MPILRLEPSALEDWLRLYYFSARYDLGSSGVKCWSFAELRALLGLTAEALDGIVFDDSDSYGDLPLRQAIATRWSDGNADRVMVTNGSTEAIFLTMNALLSPGDE